MCGILGLIVLNGKLDEMLARMRCMQEMIHHRGPDGSGIFSDPAGKPVVLGHQRLAIIDPKHGQQPMLTPDGMTALIFNGAIYNYLELRRELVQLGHPIQTYSDTEVLLYAYLEWGTECVHRFNGMFAFAIWDARKQILFCARDRVGIKPFYYYYDGDRFIFASEIKAILASGLVAAEADTESLEEYIHLQFCLEKNTLFKNIKKLEPGSWMRIALNDNAIDIHEKIYWDVQYNDGIEQDESYYVDQLQCLLEDAVSLQLRSDVPIGAYLSGGMDSSAVVGIASSILQGGGFKSFTGAFREGKAFDETAYARIVADATQTEHYETFIPSEEFSNILPKLIYYMDEPLAGPGLIPQYYVSELAAKHVKVVLGGQGGDELYVGYTRYFVGYLEKCLRDAIHGSSNEKISLNSIMPNLPLLQTYQSMLSHFWQDGLFHPEDQRYFRLLDRSEGMTDLFLTKDLFQGSRVFEKFQRIFNRHPEQSLINKMTYFDLKASLPALLHVEDRMSMAVGLESRVPLLDHRLVELMATIPAHLKFANGQTKSLFRKAIKNFVPNQILERKDKMGFPVPLQQWFNTHAKDFLHDVLFSERTRQRGIFDVDRIKKTYEKQHQFSRITWGLVCLELWYRLYIDGDYRQYANMPSKMDVNKNAYAKA